MGLPRHGTIGDFLPQEQADAMLALFQRSAEDFAPSPVLAADGYTHDPAERHSLGHSGDVGPIAALLDPALRAAFPKLCEIGGIAPFEICRIEYAPVAHRDGCFYKLHMDTLIAERRGTRADDRILTAVYYVNTRPRTFTGGDLQLHPLIAGTAEPARIAPEHNRLAVFPSFAPHQVLPVSLPGDAWAGARFSVNCWIQRAAG